MPFVACKESGNGHEGLKYAITERTKTKLESLINNC